MRSRKNTCLMALSTGLFSSFLLAQTSLPPTQELNALLAADRFAEAYALAESHLQAWEGDTDFDFAYGIAAIESGHPNESVYAFERVANSAPGNTTRQRARLELARAHFLTNNLVASEALFREVLSSNPPQNVRNNIDAFLTLIEDRRNNRQASFSFAIAPTLGHDNNVNSATSNGLIDTPLLGEIELNAEGLKTGDDFADLTLNLAYKKPFSRDRVLDLTLIANRHDNRSSDQFDIDYVLGDISYGYGDDKQRFRHSLQLQTVALDGESFLKTYRLNNSWQHAGNNGWYQGLAAAIATTRNDNPAHSSRNELKDTDQLLVSGSLTKLSQHVTNTSTLFYAEDRARYAAGKHNGRRYYGIAHSLLWRFNANNTPFARVSVQTTTYASEHPVFFKDIRSDDTLSATLGWTWRYSKQLSITGETSYNEASSNIQLFQYSRFKYQIGLQLQM